MNRNDPLIGLSDDELAAVAPHEPASPTPGFRAGSPEHPAVPTAEAIQAAPLDTLPRLLRELSELEAKLRWDWWVAYQNYRLCRARWTKHYHEYERLQITAAQIKAETDDDVINPMVESRHRWETWQTARRARINVKAELRVRTARKPIDP